MQRGETLDRRLTCPQGRMAVRAAAVLAIVWVTACTTPSSDVRTSGAGAAGATSASSSGSTPITTAGSDGSAVATSGRVPLDKASYVARVNALCRKPIEISQSFEASWKASHPGGKEMSIREHQEFTDGLDDVLVPAYTQMLADIRALEPPPGDRPMIEDALGVYDRFVAAVKTDPAGASSFVEFIDAPAADYGLTDCFSAPREKWGSTGSAIR